MLGRTIGNYQITTLIGRGGMGEVYRAEHQSRQGIRVAIKMLLPEISAHRPIVERFFNEANAVSLIKHTSIVRIFDLGYLDDRAYLVMELLDGMNVAEAVRAHGPVPTPQALDYGRQVASAVYAAHAAGIIHRDLKPDNLFLTEDHELASGRRVKVLDFGIAKLADTRTISGHTVGAMGTPAYMPPEQWQDAASVDVRSDVYALGCVLYEMVCGHAPFPGKTMPEYCTQHLTMPPPSPRAINRTLPPDFDALVLSMLAKQPAARPQTMHDVDLALAAIQEKRGLKISVDKRRLSDDMNAARPNTATPSMATQPTTLSSATGQTQPRNKTLIGAGVAIAVVAVSVFVVLVATRDGDDGGGKPGPGTDKATAKATDKATAKATDKATAPATAKATAAATATKPPPEPPSLNRWIPVDTSSSIVLGVDDAAAKAGDLGFAASRGVMSPTAGFEIQQHEVTWREVDGRDDDTPALGVSWKSARALCKTMGGDLPTEAQWELAARGLGQRPHPWGDAAPDPATVAVYRGSGAMPVAVMSSPGDQTPGPTPIHDLAGNALEWTADVWTEDASDQAPAWASEGGRVHVAIRGLPVNAAPPARIPSSATYRDALCADGPCPEGTDQALLIVGFRCVRPAP